MVATEKWDRLSAVFVKKMPALKLLQVLMFLMELQDLLQKFGKKAGDFLEKGVNFETVDLEKTWN